MQKAPLAKRGSLGRRPGVGRAYPLYFQRRSLPTVPTGESEISFLAWTLRETTESQSVVVRRNDSGLGIPARGEQA